MSGEVDPLLQKLMRAKVADYFSRRDEFILASFGRGCDTAFIAKHLKLHESIVANRLAHLRDAKFDERKVSSQL